MDIKKQELDLRKQEQEKMAVAQNQQTYNFYVQPNVKTTTGTA